MNKNISFGVAVGLLLIFSLSVVSASTNLISNSGFESGLGDWGKTSWFSPLAPSWAIDSTSTNFHSGSNSLKLSLTGVDSSPKLNKCTGQSVVGTEGVVAVGYPTIELKANTKYELISWVKVNQDADRDKYIARTRLHLYNSEDGLAGNLANQSACGTGFGDDKVEVVNFFHTEAINGEWVKITETFKTDDEFLYAHLWLIADVSDEANEGSFSVWFDDVSLKEKSTSSKDTNINRNSVTTCTVGECDYVAPFQQTTVVVDDSVAQQPLKLTSAKVSSSNAFGTFSNTLYREIGEHPIFFLFSIVVFVLLVLVLLVLLSKRY